MSKNNGQLEKKVPTLLELSNLSNRRPPSPTLSSSSDDDQPPVASSAKKQHEKSSESIFQPLTGKLTPSRSTLSLRFKRNSKEGKSMDALLNKRRSSSKSFVARSTDYLQPPSLAAAKGR